MAKKQTMGFGKPLVELFSPVAKLTYLRIPELKKKLTLIFAQNQLDILCDLLENFGPCFNMETKLWNAGSQSRGAPGLVEDLARG